MPDKGGTHAGTGLLPQLVIWLEGQSRTQLFLSAGIMVAGLSALASAIGSDLAVAVFYLAPISLAAYFVGRRQGRWIAFLSALAWTLIGEAVIPTSTPVMTLVATGATRAVLFLVIAELLSALRIAFEHERTLARTDPLTGVANPRRFAEEVEREILRARRYRRPMTVMQLDLDGFKTVNDTRGHLAGDDLLRAVARGLREALRRTDLVARLGGDEFAVLLPETNDEAADLVLGKVRGALRAVFELGSWPVTASLGVVTCAGPPDSVATLLERVDRLMYASKHAGKNRATRETVTAWEPTTPAAAAHPA
jgi:diguanylate cyclase (GGDEF)-like protein